MNYQTTQTIQSAAFPDVKYTLARPNYGTRAEIDLETAETRYQIAEIQREAAPLIEELKEIDRLGAEGNHARKREIDTKIDMLSSTMLLKIQARIDAVWVRHCLRSIDGIDIDGAPIKLTRVFEDAPTDLVAEIVEAAKRGAMLTDEERKNSPSPSTSPAPVDGPTISSSAAPVNGPPSIGSETAGSSSLAM